MFNKGQLAGLMKQAQAMQDNLKKAQDELGTIEVMGESGAGLVKVTMTCKHDVKRVEIDPSLPPTAIGDPGRISQVVAEIVSNAVKFTSVGQINVGARAAEVSEDGLLLEVTVRDTGIGMSADVQKTLFEAFVQADSSTTRRYGGTGLGLAISRRLVEIMGGEIDVTSEAGRGSTFRFTVRLGLTPETAATSCRVTSIRSPCLSASPRTRPEAKELFRSFRLLRRLNALSKCVESTEEADDGMPSPSREKVTRRGG